MHMRHVALVLAVLVMVSAGCGGKSASVPPSASAETTGIPAAVSWKDRMSAACSDLGAAVGQLPLSSDRDGLRVYLKDILALELAFDRRISSIEPSSMEAHLLERSAQDRREWESSLARLLRDIVRDDQGAALAEAGRAEVLAHRANATLEDLGLTQCLLPFTGIPG
jgi:hypothetical protein